MRFIKDYMCNPRLREMLDQLTNLVFGFDFEGWVGGGHYHGEYIPYSYVKDDRMVANASVNLMIFRCGSEIRRYVQIGTVMTHPDYRHQGLAASLLEKIIADYESRVDGIYLFGNPDAAGFYEKAGFDRGMEFRYETEQLPRRVGSGFAPAGDALKEKYYTAVLSWQEPSGFSQLNRGGLQMFYTGGMDDVYYAEDIDTFAVFAEDGETIVLGSVLGREEVALSDVLARLPASCKKVILGFTPAESDGFEARAFDGGDDYIFFCLGEKLREMEEKKLIFPQYSHA